MCKSEIFTDLLSVVSQTTEIDVKLILSPCRQQDIVDARGMLIYILYDRFNFSLQSISDHTGMMRKSVYYQVSHFKTKVEQSAILKIQYNKTVRELSEKYLKTV